MVNFLDIHGLVRAQVRHGQFPDIHGLVRAHVRHGLFSDIHGLVTTQVRHDHLSDMAYPMKRTTSTVVIFESHDHLSQ